MIGAAQVSHSKRRPNQPRPLLNLQPSPTTGHLFDSLHTAHAAGRGRTASARKARALPIRGRAYGGGRDVSRRSTQSRGMRSSSPSFDRFRRCPVSCVQALRVCGSIPPGQFGNDFPRGDLTGTASGAALLARLVSSSSMTRSCRAAPPLGLARWGKASSRRGPTAQSSSSRSPSAGVQSEIRSRCDHQLLRHRTNNSAHYRSGPPLSIRCIQRVSALQGASYCGNEITYREFVTADGSTS